MNEFALAHAIGLRPLAQVMGSSIYHVGWQQQPGRVGRLAAGRGLAGADDVVSEAWNAARLRAFARLEQEATLVGADAVVGVQLTTRPPRLGGRRDRIRRRRHRGAGRRRRAGRAARAHRPVRAGLLEAPAGRLPAARRRRRLDASTTSFPAGRQQQAQRECSRAGQTRSCATSRSGVYDARETALGRMSAEARQHGAAGVVGVSIAHSRRGARSRVGRIGPHRPRRHLPRARHERSRERRTTAASSRSRRGST